jgi:uncharacterized protein
LYPLLLAAKIKIEQSMTQTNGDFCATGLNEIAVSHRLDSCPPFLSHLVTEAVAQLSPFKVSLFGSRARGDHRRASDYDLCFWLDANHKDAWQNFREWVDANAQTLASIDLVDWDEASAQLKEAILREGVVIYEQN